jgi:phage repressor protein C with HTH and peptisase S24 domain
MEEAGLDQSALARAAGCTPGAINQIVGGHVQRSRFLPEIAEALGVSLRWLKGENVPKDPAAPIVATQSVAPALEELDLVAIAEIDLAYGMGGTYTDLPVEVRALHFPRTWLESITRSPPSELILARGRGDSMQPTLQDGDMVIIDRSQRTVREQDAIWALTIGEIGMIKRLRVRGERVSILSDNQNVPVDEATADEVSLVGRVVYIGRKV